jgi:hypothetical protein
LNERVHNDDNDDDDDDDDEVEDAFYEQSDGDDAD